MVLASGLGFSEEERERGMKRIMGEREISEGTEGGNEGGKVKILGFCRFGDLAEFREEK